MTDHPNNKRFDPANGERKLHFITYGNKAFDEAKKRIAGEADATQRFASIRICSPADVSADVRNSPQFQVRRGAGYWIWKPDVILSELERIPEGDVLFYSDAGCRLFDSPEWEVYSGILSTHDVLAFRMWHRTHRWTKRECLEYFAGNPPEWIDGFQYFATFIGFRKSDFSVAFVREWRETMLRFPDLVGDVPEEERASQKRSFIEHRHDQSVFSALVYKYSRSGRIFPRWEHSDTLDPFASQAVFNARMRTERTEAPALFRRMVFAMSKRICFRWFDLFDPSVRRPFRTS